MKYVDLKTVQSQPRMWFAIASLLVSFTCRGQEVSPKDHRALSLDLSHFVAESTDKLAELDGLYGDQYFDAIPFSISGAIRFYGVTAQTNQGAVYPNGAFGISIERKFNELHLIHHSMWPDLEHETIAYVCLNYKDGMKLLVPIRYGEHVRDWQHLPSYATDEISDPNSRIIFTRDPVRFDAPVRIYKTMIENPLPDKLVTTMDVATNGKLSTYTLLAATVSDSSGPLTEGITPLNRNFDSAVLVQVVDAETDQPIPGAVVYPSVTVKGFQVVGEPVATVENGTASIGFSKADTTRITLTIQREGYGPAIRNVDLSDPKELSVKLNPADE